MTFDEYKPLALRTNNDLGPEGNLIHAALLIPSEAGEIADVIKKHYVYGQALDQAHLIEEVGDLCWGVNLLLDTIGVSWDYALQANIRKLEVRYPSHQFTTEGAMTRDKAAEAAAVASPLPRADKTIEERGYDDVGRSNAPPSRSTLALATVMADLELERAITAQAPQKGGKPLLHRLRYAFLSEAGIANGGALYAEAANEIERLAKALAQQEGGKSFIDHESGDFSITVLGSCLKPGDVVVQWGGATVEKVECDAPAEFPDSVVVTVTTDHGVMYCGSRAPLTIKRKPA